MELLVIKVVFKIVVLLSFMFHYAVLTDYHADEILWLPGLHHSINFRQYSGYLNASDGTFLHYWFVESQRTPDEDPLLLWLSGGPGCSSLDGLLGEVGPFRVMSDGITLHEHEYSWNKVANIIFLESPVGVGFSYSLSKNYTSNDDSASLDNYIALQSFFTKFPHFKKNDLYITGESYAGVYIPTLAVRVLGGEMEINLKGLIIGNGQLDRHKSDQSLLFFHYYHGIIGYQRWNNLTKYCCTDYVSKTNCSFFGTVKATCGFNALQAYKYVFALKINNYNVYDNCFMPVSHKSSKYTFHRFNHRTLYPEEDDDYYETHEHFQIPCVDASNVTYYLEQKVVRDALHIPRFVASWEICNSVFMKTYRKLYVSVKPQMLKLLRSGRIRVLLYSGDVDAVCNFLGSEWFVKDLDLPEEKPYDLWRYNNKLAGFVKYYTNLTFLTIKGAGHMAAQYKPEQTLKVIKNFLYNLPYDAPC